MNGHPIKYYRLRDLRPESRYPETFRAICNNIPQSLWDTLSARQLAEVVEAIQAGYQAGKDKSVSICQELHGDLEGFVSIYA